MFFIIIIIGIIAADKKSVKPSLTGLFLLDISHKQTYYKVLILCIIDL